MSRFELRPFATQESETIAHWAATIEEVWQVTGTHDFPLTGATVTGWTREADHAFTLRRDGDLVAYGEIVEDEVEGDIEVQHLLVAPDMRHLGVGQAMLSRLCAFIAGSRPYREIWTRVGRDNPIALRCAEAVGFVQVEAMSGPRYLWLKKTLRPGAEL